MADDSKAVSVAIVLKQYEREKWEENPRLVCYYGERECKTSAERREKIMSQTKKKRLKLYETLKLGVGDQVCTFPQAKNTDTHTQKTHTSCLNYFTIQGGGLCEVVE